MEIFDYYSEMWKHCNDFVAHCMLAKTYLYYQLRFLLHLCPVQSCSLIAHVCALSAATTANKTKWKRDIHQLCVQCITTRLHSGAQPFPLLSFHWIPACCWPSTMARKKGTIQARTVAVPAATLSRVSRQLKHSCRFIMCNHWFVISATECIALGSQSLWILHLQWSFQMRYMDLETRIMKRWLVPSLCGVSSFQKLAIPQLRMELYDSSGQARPFFVHSSFARDHMIFWPEALQWRRICSIDSTVPHFEHSALCS